MHTITSDIFLDLNQTKDIYFNAPTLSDDYHV